MRNKFLLLNIITLLCFPPFDLAAQQKQLHLPASVKLGSDIQTQLAVADTFFVKAERFSARAAYDSAFSNYENASKKYFTLSKKTNKPEFWTKYVMAENGCGAILQQKTKNNEVLQRLEKILEFGILKLGRMNADVASCQTILGSANFGLGNYDKALEYYLESLQTRRQVHGENHALVAATLNNIGAVYNRKSAYSEAISYYQKSLEIRRKLFGDSHPRVAMAYTNIGMLYKDFGKYDLALEYQKQALDIHQKTLVAHHPLIATNYNNLANIYYDKGDYENSIEFYQKSLLINRKAYGEIHLETATNYSNLGNVYSSLGDHEKALIYQKKALAVWSEALGPEHEKTANAYNNIGNSYDKLGDIEKALGYYLKALNIKKLAFGEMHRDVALSYHNLGGIYLKKSAYNEALNSHMKELQIHKSIYGEVNLLTAKTYTAIGNVFLHKGEMRSALENFQRALTIKRNLFIDINPQVVSSMIDLGEALLLQNNAKGSLHFLQKALMSLTPSFNDTNFTMNPGIMNARSKLEFFRAFEIKARALRALFEQTKEFAFLRSSLITSELAVELSSIILQDYQSEESKLILNKRRSGSIKEALQTALLLRHKQRDEAYAHRAFRIASSSKAHVLSQTVMKSNSKEFSGIPDSLLQKERELQIDLAFYKTAAQKQYMKQKPDSLEIANLEDRQFARRREYESLVAYFEKAYPKYFGLKFKNDTPSVQELQSALDTKSALVEYFLSDSSLYIFTITRNDFKITVSTADSSLQKAINDYFYSFKSFTGQARGNYRQNAAKLYQKLIQPVEKYVADKPRWVIIPHNELCQIPFEALLRRTPASPEDDTKLDYLVKHHEISYHYSTALFLNQRLIQQKKLLATKAPHQSKRRGEYLAAQGFIGFAPVFSDNAANGRITGRDAEMAEFWADSTSRGENTFRETTEGLKLRPLPYSEKELEKINTLFLNKKQVSIGYFHQEASEEKFKMEAGKFTIVHVSTHGLYNTKYPNLSGLVFSQHQPVPTNDGLLHAAEVYNLELNAELLVLSSCESAAGPLQKGEGLMALTRAFIYAGANNILASLWKVRDQHTSELMIAFYEEVLQGKRYGEALRAAKLKMIANPETAGPQSWAGFILIGR